VTLSILDILPATPRARIVRLDLAGSSLPYDAGQAVYVGMHGSGRRKPYSIAASPEDAARDGWLELLIGVDEQGDAGDHLALEPAARVDVDGPIGAFTFPRDVRERRLLFVAGGTGIAPLRAMLRHALIQPQRKIGLLYSARTPAEFAYEAELRGLAVEGRIELRQTVTRTGDDDWQGGRGRIGIAELAPLVHDPETLCFVCGPPSLVDDIPRLLQELGVARDRIRLEEW